MELFVGDTHEHGEDGFTVGLTYEYRLNELFGIGGFAEYTGGHFDKWSAGVPLFMRPYGEFRFAFAPGFEHNHDEEEFLFRAGVAYEFKLSDPWVLVPELNVDFVDGEEVYVFGLAIGFGY
ncbi:MAG: hypothetical protein JSW12_09655 [Deltaproteobacteria bacterium]|nr:MAG: hypothetical protein JSW12_09655 [Deltaproteobacteria bacterium]